MANKTTDEKDLHPSAQRLHEAMKRMAGVEGASNIATLLNQSPQVVTNWGRRGVSETWALLTQGVIGCNAIWILTGSGGMVEGWPFSAELLTAVIGLNVAALRRLENLIRTQCDLPLLTPGQDLPPQDTGPSPTRGGRLSQAQRP